jgi:hypothetical protein
MHIQLRRAFNKTTGPVWDILWNYIWICHHFVSKCPVQRKSIIANPLRIKLLCGQEPEKICIGIISFKRVLFPFKSEVVSLNFLFRISCSS